MTDYHMQSVNIVLKKDDELFKRLTKVAAQNGVPVENVVDTIVSMGVSKLIEERLSKLER